MGNSVSRSENRPASDDTRRLLRAYHVDGDTRARARLIELYLPLVSALARRYSRGGEQHEDLVQVGSIGLIKAIDRFDLEHGGELAAFAVPNISGEMKRHLRDSGHTIKLPRGLAELRGQLPAAREGLTARLGREPSSAELASELDVDERSLARVLSAERPSDSPDEALAELTGGLPGADERLALADAFGHLDERERQIIYLRFVKDLDSDEVARELGVSKRHLSRQTQAALAKLRGQLETGPGGVVPAPAKVAPQRLPREARRPNISKVKSVPPREGAEYLDRPYHIVVVRNGDDDGWTAQVEELPGCEARADTPDEATRAIRDSMEAWFAKALASEREIPEPRGASTHSGRLMLRMPQSLHAELARAAERDEVSLNQFITGSLAGAVGWRQQNGDGELQHDEARGERPEELPTRKRGGRWLSRAMVVNAVLLGLACVAAVALLVVALTQGS
ncbi:MAG TPA: sigma-70 family RNA polymerase sigma factor [Thermoleophilaceae bacterium]